MSGKSGKEEKSFRVRFQSGRFKHVNAKDEKSAKEKSKGYWKEKITDVSLTPSLDDIKKSKNKEH